jgi:hypothetical protein
MTGERMNEWLCNQ